MRPADDDKVDQLEVGNIIEINTDERRGLGPSYSGKYEVVRIIEYSGTTLVFNIKNIVNDRPLSMSRDTLAAVFKRKVR